MLLGDFFTYQISVRDVGAFTADIQLNAAHDIFKGHFPTSPIVPGVCQVQMLQDVLGEVLEQRLQLLKAKDIKFLAMIDPRVDNSLQLELKLAQNEGLTLVTGVLSAQKKKCLKFKGVFGEK